MDRRRRRGAFALAAVCALALVLIGGGVARATGSTVIDASHCNQADLQNAISSGDVTFSADCTIHLTSALDLSHGPSTIDGSGYAVVLDGQGSTRIFGQTTASDNYSLIHLTLENGNAGSGDGGVIHFGSSGTLTVTNSTFLDNSVGAYAGGGAIYGANVDITGSTFRSNTGFEGGAAYLTGGTNTLTDDTFNSNSVQFSGLGGALYDDGGNTAITDTTFDGNSTGTGGQGGAIFASGLAVETIDGSTFSANSGGSTAGAIDAANATETIKNSTFSGNSLAATYLTGAAISVAYETANLQNDTFAGNVGQEALQSTNGASIELGHVLFSGNGTDCGGSGGGTFVDDGYNLTDTDGTSCAFSDSSTGGTDILSTDAKLGALADYGGPTKTMALQATSPAAAQDSGNDCGLSTDQRGVTRPTGHCSIGAFQWDSVHQYVGTCDETTLDSAVGVAVANNSPSTIKFGCDGTIGLTSTITVPSGGGSVDVTLDGNGHSVTIDGGGDGTAGCTGVRLFNIGGASFTIDGLTLAHGCAGIGQFGSVVQSFDGGSQLTITDSTVEDNYAFSDTIFSYGYVTVTNTTFAHNLVDQGGAVYYGQSSPATFTGDSFVDNTNVAGYVGSAALTSDSATVTLQNNLFSGNGTNCYTGTGTFVDNGSNFADGGSDGGGCGFSGSEVNGGDPHLGPLQDNGGPTQTFAVTQLSPPVVADAQDSCGLATDQRGAARQSGNCSIGAYQYDATNQTISACDEAHLDGTVGIAARDTAAGTVRFGCDGTIGLTSQISLPNAAHVTVDATGHSVVLDGQATTRIFDDEHPSGDLTLDHLTLRNGHMNGDSGGAIRFDSGGTLTIDNSSFVDNSVSGSGLTGGAIEAVSVVISNTAFTGNSVPGSAGAGGAIMLVGGAATLTDDTFSSNSVGVGGTGGAILNDGGITTIVRTTFDGNTTGDHGRGGAFFSASSSDTITNSTFSGNLVGALGHGSAISDGSVNMTLKGDTLVGNNSGDAAISPFALLPGSTLEIGWTLFSGDGVDCSSNPITTDDGYNLTDTGGSGCGFTAGTDTFNTDAHLAALADNGGATRTFALTQLSPPIAADSQADCGLSGDQRGATRQSGNCSIGAYQYDATNQTISTCDEAHLDGTVGIAARDTTGGTVTFGCDGTIDLTSQITLPDAANVTVDATGHNVILDGQGSSRIFDDENSTGNLTLEHLTLQNGTASCGCNGGAIEFYTSSGTLTITGSTFLHNSVGFGATGGAIDATSFAISNSTFRGNSAGDFGAGGGVALEGGSGTLTDDTFSSNSAGAEGAGGALSDNNGTATISRTTFDGNSAADYGLGGAIFGNYSTDTITNSTFSGNTVGSAGAGSAIGTYAVGTTLQNDTVVGNTGGDAAVSDQNIGYGGTLEIGGTLFASNGTDCSVPATVDNGYNLGGDGSCGFTDGLNNDIVTSTPRLIPLGDYGGPTKTVALQSTSPAVDAGSCAFAVDQRGVSRPQGGSCDIGAYEANPVVPVTSLQLSPSSPTGRNGWYTTVPQATLTPSNPNSSTVSTFYGVNDSSCESTGTCTSYSAPFSVPDGTQTLTYYSQDLSPAFEGSHTAVVKVDTTAPSSSIDLNGYVSGSWTNQDVTFGVSGTDATSGIANSYYEVDRLPITRYSSPVTVSADGKHRVVYRSIDNAGNVETWNTAMVLIDKTPPLLSGAPTTSPNANGWYHSNVTIKWSCSDALSGISSCPANSTISTEGGSLTASGTAFDTAGNSTSATSSPAVNVDKTAPTTAGALSNSGFHSGSYYAGPVTLTLTPSDALSGVDTTYYTVDGGLPQVYSAPVSYDTVGKHVFRYWSTDLAGNVEAQHVLGFNLIHPPGAPTLGSLTRGVRSLGVSWSAPSDAGGDIVRSYVITYVNQTTSVSATKTVPASPTSATLTGLTNGTTYSVTVQAVDAAGAGPASSGQTATTYALPDAPTSFSSTLADGGAHLTWSSGASDGGTAVTSYALQIIGGGGSTSQSFDPSTACTVSGCTANVSGLTNGVWYTLRLWSVNGAGKSVSYASSTVKPFAVPGKPTAVGASGGVRRAVVTWEPPSATGGGIASYTITATGGATPVVKTVTVGSACAADPCTATIGGLGNGIAYTITVAASNPAGTSAPSDPASATTKAAPAVPTSFAASPHVGGADLTWQAPASDGGSAITGYRLRVYSGSSLVNTISVNCTTASCSYTLTGLTGGVTYTLYVNAVNAVGNGGSASATVTPT